MDVKKIMGKIVTSITGTTDNRMRYRIFQLNTVLMAYYILMAYYNSP